MITIKNMIWKLKKKNELSVFANKLFCNADYDGKGEKSKKDEKVYLAQLI